MNASDNQSESDADEAVSSPSIGDKVPDDSTATSSACK